MTPRWWCASGTWEHAKPPPGFDYYVLKTATLGPRDWTDVAREKLTGGWTALPDTGYLNEIGLRNPGVTALLRDPPAVPGHRVLSVIGQDAEEWSGLATAAEVARIPILELNMKWARRGSEHYPIRMIRAIYSGRLGVKLPPTANARAAEFCEHYGADYLCLTNSLPTPMGGLSGRPLRALALRRIAEAAGRVKIPIVGGGGLIERADAEHYLSAGATDLFIGAGNLVRGGRPEGG